MSQPFAAFEWAPVPPAVTRLSDGQRQYVLPLALETHAQTPEGLNALKDTLSHLEAHAAFLRVQLWVHTLLAIWKDQMPQLERFGVVCDGDSALDFGSDAHVKDWKGWFWQADWNVGVVRNGDFETVSYLRARTEGVEEGQMVPFSTFFVRQVLSVPKDPQGKELMRHLLTQGMGSEENMRQGWTREEWSHRLASLEKHPEVFAEVRSQQLEASLPAPRSPGRGGPRF